MWFNHVMADITLLIRSVLGLISIRSMGLCLHFEFKSWVIKLDNLIQHIWHLFHILLAHQILFIHPKHLTCCSRHVIWHERHWQPQTPCATGHRPGCKGTPQCGPVGLWYDSEDAPRCAGHCSPAPGTCKIKVSANLLLVTATQDSLSLHSLHCAASPVALKSHYWNGIIISVRTKTCTHHQSV